MVESSIVLYKNSFGRDTHQYEVVDFQIGSPSSVEFDFMKLRSFLNKRKQMNYGVTDLHFIHVHPKEFGVQMSRTDVDCLLGLEIAFGTSPLFSIVTFNDEDLSNVKGDFASYTVRLDFDGTQDKKEIFNEPINPFAHLEVYPFLFILKHLSLRKF